MKHGTDAGGANLIENLVAKLGSWKDHVEHMVIADAVFRDDRESESSFGFERFECSAIVKVNLSSSFGDAFHFLKLTVQKGAADFAGDVRRSHINPRVLIHFAAKVSLSICAFVADDFSSFDQFRVIDAECSAFAADEVFGFVEAVAAEISDGPQCATVVPRIDALCGVFDDGESVSSGDCHDAVHFTADASVVDDADGTCLGCDGVFDQSFIDVEGIGTNVNKSGFCAESYEGGGGGDEGVGGHDDFITGADIAELCGHFEGGGAGGGEEHFANTESILQELGAFVCEVSIAAEVAEGDSLGDVVEFLAGDEGFVEWNIHAEAFGLQCRWVDLAAGFARLGKAISVISSGQADGLFVVLEWGDWGPQIR